MKMEDFQKQFSYAHKLVFGKEIEFENENPSGMVPEDFDEFCETPDMMFSFKDGKMTLSTIVMHHATQWEPDDMDVADIETFSSLREAVNGTMMFCFGKKMEIVDENMMVEEMMVEEAEVKEYMNSLKYAESE